MVTLSVEQVQLAIQELEKRKGVAERAVEINRLENEADRCEDVANLLEGVVVKNA